MFHRIRPIPPSLLESPLAACISSRELRTLELRGTAVHFASGRRAMAEDGIGRECMVVVDGAFAVERDGRRVAELHAGDFMGEIALLTNRRRNATVTATQDSNVYAFNRREFMSLLRECPDLAAHVRAAAAERSLVA